ncbi:hypothetical protein [Amycolatopsis sp. cmx-8-4]|uniref:hypothetical protein n=1 Tax=Amycolatopsis sp. cmx-8-4 TaxID=2790947 RepID=UPI00397E3683
MDVGNIRPGDVRDDGGFAQRSARRQLAGQDGLPRSASRSAAKQLQRSAALATESTVCTDAASVCQLQVARTGRPVNWRPARRSRRERTGRGMSGHLCAITGQGDEFVDQPRRLHPICRWRERSGPNGGVYPVIGVSGVVDQ